MSAPEHIVVVGASLAGLRVVEALRRQGHEGRVTLIGDETHLPYDRPPLSKQVLLGSWEPERTALTTPERLAEADVDLVLGRRAVAAHAEAIRLEDGAIIPYSHLVVATGARARSWPGMATHDRVHGLRTLDDALRLRAALAADPGCPVVVVGGGFIGLEVAAAARAGGHEVTVVEAASRPLERAVGPLVGDHFVRLHAAAGVVLRCGTAISAITPDPDGVSVWRDDGSELRARHAVVGIGSVPNTEWTAGLGLDTTDGIACDEGGRAAPRVWAVGDVARWRQRPFGDLARHEHWTSAAEQAAVVAAGLLGHEPNAPCDVPYFWSTQYDVNFQLAGRPDLADSVDVTEPGDPQTGRGTLFTYRRAGRTVAVAAFHQPGRFLRLRRTLQEELAAPAAIAP
ncbi:NAD(P)/FAD-dependent oxidoreductase [Nocardioides humi]|uniref:FAD/NAD(P)-binding oxidoreductase n=1 Tax=Nocardioides humi TaxID=449461 RepID=A0ABN2AFE2_9ACTN|nr:FAD-dependent oxidoreductase [Nocardioides humi]